MENIQKNYVLCCIDGSSFANDICDYGVEIANNLNLDLMFLNIIEQDNSSKNTTFSGNINVSEKDKVLENLAKEDQEKNIKTIKKSKLILEQLQKRAKEKLKNQVVINQKRGNVVQNILAKENAAQIILIGFKSDKNKNIGKNVKDIIRFSKLPVFLVNSKYQKIKKIILAFDAKEHTKISLIKSLETNLFTESEYQVLHVLDSKKEQQNQDWANDFLKKTNSKITKKILYGKPQEEILDYYLNQSFDLLCMGAFGHSRVKELVFGSLTDFMLKNLLKPILLIK